MARDLEGKCVVVTGASSGIGRATALRFARKGAAVVLGARDRAALHDVEQAITRAGGRAHAVECDVADEDAVERLAASAEERFGPIAVWVNNAAVLAMGKFEDTPPEVFRRLMDTNLMGVVNGCRAALRRFKAQGEGALVNVASIDGKIAAPYASAYVASKHAVVGFSSSLRQELRLEGHRRVHVSVVMPATIDTPLFQHAANFTGVEVKALPPVYSPERVARVIEGLARRPARQRLVGGNAYFLSALWSLSPALAERMIARTIHRQHLRHERPRAETPGNAFAPRGPEAETGGWQLPAPRRWAKRAAAMVVPAAVAAAGVAWVQQRRA